MKKVDIIVSLIIGAISALIAMFVLSSADWSQLPLIGKYPYLVFIVFPIGAVGMIFVANVLAAKITVLLQIAKCFLVGVLNTFIDLGALGAFMWIIFAEQFSRTREMIVLFGSIEIDPLYAAFKAFSVSIAAVNSYFWNKYWTFDKRGTKPEGKEFIKLYIVTGAGFFLNIGISTFIFKNVDPLFGLELGAWGIFAAGMAAFVSFVWNFVGYKFLVFKK